MLSPIPSPPRRPPRAVPAVLLALALSVAALPAAAQEGNPLTVEAHVLRPARVDATPERISGLELPDGLRIDVFARDLGHSRMLEVTPDGTVYVTRPQQGDVLMLRDTDGDGRADQRRTAAEIQEVHGIEVADGAVYLVSVHEIYAGRVQEDGSFGGLRTIYEDLPDGGQHPNRTLAVGPDGRLYVTVGSLSNAAPTPVDERTASILRMKIDGSGEEVFAQGLRNTIGFGWHPETGEMWGMDHGIDWLGDDRPPEELNRLVAGTHYGWPWVYGNQEKNPTAEAPPGGWEAFLERSVSAVLGYTAHAAPLQLAFYTGEELPPAYRGDAFVAMRGSWNRQPPAGYEVVRIRFDDEGRPEAIEPFVTGFLVERPEGGYAHFGRLAGMAVAADGALLVGDDTNGVIYRISRDD